MADKPTARFYTNAGDINNMDDELPQVEGKFDKPFEVTKVIQMTEHEYQEFCENLSGNYHYISNNSYLCDTKSDTMRCLLVQEAHDGGGVLIAVDYVEEKVYTANLFSLYDLDGFENIPIELTPALYEKIHADSACFHKDAVDINELSERHSGEPYVVKAVVELNLKDYAIFTSNLSIDGVYTFVHDHRHFMESEPGMAKGCILVKAKHHRVDGVLICKNEFAYVCDCEKLDVGKLPTHQYSLMTYEISSHEFEPEPENSIITEAVFCDVVGHSDTEMVQMQSEVMDSHEFNIAKVVQLNAQDFFRLQSDICMDYSYILENIQVMISDSNNQCPINCILVRRPDYSGGILLTYDTNTERIAAAAYVDVNRLVLDGIPVEQQTSWQCTAKFVEQPASTDDLHYQASAGTNRIHVNRVFQFSEDEFTVFSECMDDSFDFLQPTPDNQYSFNPLTKELDCALVKAVNSDKGILVVPNIYNAIELGAFVEDCSKLRVMTKEEKHLYSQKARRGISHQKNVRVFDRNGEIQTGKGGSIAWQRKIIN